MSVQNLRHDYKTDEVIALFNLPLTELMDKARQTHIKYHSDNTVQLASLLSIRTGYCPENCKYCPQSAHLDSHFAPTTRGRSGPLQPTTGSDPHATPRSGH